MANPSVIGQDTVIRGNVHGQGSLEIYGRVQGDIRVDGDVVLGERSEIRGSVSGAQIRVSGMVEGDLRGAEAVLVEPGARVAGDMIAPRIGIANGALVRGMVRTEGEPELSSASGRRSAAPVGRSSAFTSSYSALHRGAPAASRAEASPRSEALGRGEATAEASNGRGESREEARSAPAAQSSALSASGAGAKADASAEPGEPRSKSKAKSPPEPVVPAISKGTRGRKKAARKRA